MPVAEPLQSKLTGPIAIMVMLDGQTDSDCRMTQLFSLLKFVMKFWLDSELQTEFRHNLTHTK